MRELLRTSDPVLVSFLTSLLVEAGLAFHVADTGMSAIEGSIGVFPRRLLVAEADYAEARRIAQEAGLERELPHGAAYG